MDESTNTKELAPQMLFCVRVKLPSSGAYHCSPSGDTEFEQARNSAIFAVKPRGFEVKWPRSGESWPVDSEGFTYVPLFVTDHRDALAYAIEEQNRMRKRLDAIAAGFKAIQHLL
jgi:hypothetical protein